MVVFRYKRNSTEGYFPIVDFFVSKKGLATRVLALIDSGATVSIFKEDVAEQLAITIENGKKVSLGGVGGEIRGYIHQLDVEIAGKKFVCPVVFSREYTVSFNLLGRDAFFKNFKIIFEEKKNTVNLE